MILGAAPGGRRRGGRPQQGGRHRCIRQPAIGVDQGLPVCLEVADPLGEGGIARHGRLHCGRALRREFAVDVGVQVQFGHCLRHQRRSSSSARNRSRARASRDITVPTGMPSSPTISR